jgi:hypothetical protein
MGYEKLILSIKVAMKIETDKSDIHIASEINREYKTILKFM